MWLYNRKKGGKKNKTQKTYLKTNILKKKKIKKSRNLLKFVLILLSASVERVILYKSCNLFKYVSVLLSTSVERVGVSRIRDFFSLHGNGDTIHIG